MLLRHAWRGPLKNHISHTSVAPIRTFIGVRIGKPHMGVDSGRHGQLKARRRLRRRKRRSILRHLPMVYRVSGQRIMREPSTLTVRPGIFSASPPEFRRAATDLRVTQRRFPLQVLTAMARRRRDDARRNPSSGVKQTTPRVNEWTSCNTRGAGQGEAQGIESRTPLEIRTGHLPAGRFCQLIAPSSRDS